jgi:hypothetical protein
MARSKYVGMQKYLDAGVTVRDVGSNYIQSYSKLLEVNPDTVELDNPLIQKALQGTPDAKTGVPQMQTLYDFERQVRQDPRWAKTQNAHTEMTNATIGVLRDMGLYG